MLKVMKGKRNLYFCLPDDKCSTDKDCKNTCGIGYLCSCNKGTCEINKKEKTFRRKEAGEDYAAGGNHPGDKPSIAGVGSYTNRGQDCSDIVRLVKNGNSNILKKM